MVAGGNTKMRNCEHKAGTYESTVKDDKTPGTRCVSCDKLLKVTPLSEWK